MLQNETSLLLTRLSGWYAFQCDGDWEHQQGIKISTLDNPGWSLSVDLTETHWEERPIEEVRVSRTENNWLVIMETHDDGKRQYRSCGGPNNLDEMIQRFNEWATNA